MRFCPPYDPQLFRIWPNFSVSHKKPKTQKTNMKRSIINSILCSALLVLVYPTAHAADSASTGGTPTRHESILISATAKISAIDMDKREVTLKDSIGNEETFIVDKRVKRLNEFKVGDLVAADYYVSFAAELRKPTKEEEKDPIQVLEAAGKADSSLPPGVGAVRRLKVVATIEGMDRATSTIKVKGPLGRFVTARVENPANFAKMKLGDHIVITYTEALAISLDKVEKKSSE